MRKSGLFKISVIFMLMTVMVMATAFTAYAYDGYPDDAEPPAIDGQHEEYQLNITADEVDSDSGGEHTLPAQEAEPPLGGLVVVNSTHDGQLLQGAVFALYPAGEPTQITEMTTDSTGRTSEVPLPQGNYNVAVLTPANGFATVADVIGTTITSGYLQELTVFSVPMQQQESNTAPEQTQPNVDSGRLLLTLKAQGTGQLLGGAVYELSGAMDGVIVSHLTTDGFGEAAIDLPTGDYFVREIQAAEGFILNPNRVNVRIAANRLTEVNLTSRPEPVEEPKPPQEQPKPGRLIVTLKADGTKEPIQGAVFEVRRAMDDRLMDEIDTDRFGEAALSLQPGDYFLRQLSAPRGFDFDTGRVNVRIAEGALREVSVTNRRHTPASPPEQPEVKNGRVLITVVSSDTNVRVEGVVYTIHDVMTDGLIATITTNAFGEASAFLPPGQYFIRNTVMPQGYVREAERVNFTIRSDAVTNMSITARAVPKPTPSPSPAPTAPPSSAASSTPPPNKPTQSRVEIISRAEVSGHPLHGAVFEVYHAADNQRVGEVTTDMNGKAAVSLGAGEYYLRNNSVPYGFLREQSRIFFTVKNGDVTVEVTAQRDESIPYVEVGNINLPRTGELTPVMNYALGALSFALALLCGAALVFQYKQEQKQKYRRKRNRNRNLRRGKAYA
jgi:uncharacterized surface anchored protein